VRLHALASPPVVHRHCRPRPQRRTRMGIPCHRAGGRCRRGAYRQLRAWAASVAAIERLPLERWSATAREAGSLDIPRRCPHRRGPCARAPWTVGCTRSRRAAASPCTRSRRPTTPCTPPLRALPRHAGMRACAEVDLRGACRQLLPHLVLAVPDYRRPPSPAALDLVARWDRRGAFNQAAVAGDPLPVHRRRRRSGR